MGGKVDTQAILTFTNSKSGQQVDRGECYDLAREALAQAGAKVASDFGAISDDADYIWGQQVQLQAVKAGDVLQYRNYSIVETTRQVTKVWLPDIKDPAEFSETPFTEYTRPHHTSIVMGPPNGNQISVMEQNVDRGGVVQRTVGPSTILIASKKPDKSNIKKQVPLDRALIDKIKAAQSDYEQRKLLEQVLGPKIGTLVNTETNTVITVEVSGTVKAYRPQPK